MKKLPHFIKNNKILIIFISLFLFYNIFPDFYKKKTLRTCLGTSIFIKNQSISPYEARKIVVETAKNNPEFKKRNNNLTWTRMFVSGDEYFFPANWPKDSVREYGYYFDPKTQKTRYVNNDYYFNFPLFYDRTSVDAFFPQKNNE